MPLYACFNLCTLHITSPTHCRLIPPHKRRVHLWRLHWKSSASLENMLYGGGAVEIKRRLAGDLSDRYAVYNSLFWLSLGAWQCGTCIVVALVLQIARDDPRFG